MSQNPLDTYRRAQRALRRDFDAFTSVHCATCPAPCCVRPARIVPADILLAQGIGWRPPASALEEGDAVQVAARDTAEAINGPDDEAPRRPCQYLGERGCTFPADLRPYGCTAYICPIMYERLDRATLTRMKRLVKDLDRAHQALMTALHRKYPGARLEDE